MIFQPCFSMSEITKKGQNVISAGLAGSGYVQKIELLYAMEDLWFVVANKRVLKCT